MLNKRLKNLAIVGCSYSHWKDGDCLNESYPAIIAQRFPNYNVIDLSMCGDSNEAAYYKIKKAEEFFGIKFDKIIWQITHFYRKFYLTEGYSNYQPFNFIQKGNYTYTKGEYENQWDQTYFIPLHSWMAKDVKYHWASKFMKMIENKLGLNKKNIFYILENHSGHWHVQKTIDLLNARYGKENVLMFGWHKNFHYDSNRDKLKMEENFIGCIEDHIGTDRFWRLGVDDAPHYNAKGHKHVWKIISPDVERLLER
jgi:hypothetical protein